MRNIPDNNLAYPVLLTWDTGSTGSGFRIRFGDITYLVTAKHVLFNNDLLRGNNLQLTCQTENINDDSSFVFEVNMKQLQADGKLFGHPRYDIAGFMESKNIHNADGSFTGALVEGVKVRSAGNSPIVTINGQDSISMISDVLISNDVYVYGYPSSLGLRQLPQFDYSKPLLRKGIVASVNRSLGTIILDCPVYYGNSGGPVVQVEQQGMKYRHSVIGVVSQFIPYSENWQNLSNGFVQTEISNSGYSVAVAMDYVLEMLNVKP